MQRLTIALALTLLAVGPLGCAAPHRAIVAGTEEAQVMESVHRFVDAFNKGDVAAAAAACADDLSIIDEVPPHEWHGAGAFSRWAGDYDTDAKKNGITDGVVTLGDPRHVDVAGDRAYVVVPVDYEYKIKGKAAGETDSMLAIALTKGAAGWRISGWAWAKN